MSLDMNITWACIFLAGGLLILWKSADLLVRGAVTLAKRFGVSPLVIGLTIVAMGTSAPEVAASIAGALRGMGDVAVGNVFGSNIANLALVGGLCAIIRPISIRKQTLRREIPVMLATALLLWPILHNLYLSRSKGTILLAVFFVLVLLTVYFTRREAKDIRRDTNYEIHNTTKCIIYVIIGLFGLALGADIAVRGAVFIGERVGLSHAVIGLTMIAVGTSLPELATSVVAAIKKEYDISVGNLVGSNIFNTLLVTGTAGVVRPFAIAQRLAGSDFWIMISVSGLFAFLAMAGKRTISRTSGGLLLFGYVTYIIYLLTYSR